MWIRPAAAQCVPAVVRFWRTTSSSQRFSLWREVEEFHLLWDSLSLLTVLEKLLFLVLVFTQVLGKSPEPRLCKVGSVRSSSWAVSSS